RPILPIFVPRANRSRGIRCHRSIPSSTGRHESSSCPRPRSSRATALCRLLSALSACCRLRPPPPSATQQLKSPGKPAFSSSISLLAPSRTQRLSLPKTLPLSKRFASESAIPWCLPGGKHLTIRNFTQWGANSKLDRTAMVSLRAQISKWAVLFSASILLSAANSFAQIADEKPKEKPEGSSQEKPSEPPNAPQIELLETKYRFESNGDSRKEVRALVRINSELGVRQFGRLNFDYNRSFQSVEIPLVHITHANAGTSDILPSAITDTPNPAVEKFPAYHDVRIKSVRILGLEPGDTLEYRVITTTTKPPLAPDFWLSHSFDRTGVTFKQTLELNLPSAVQVQLSVRPEIPSATTEDVKQAQEARHVYGWNINSLPETDSEAARPDI